MKKFFNKKISIIVLIIAIFSSVLFFESEADSRKDVIDTKNNEIIKNQDAGENINIADREIVQIRFSWEVDGFKYSDAINIPKDQYDKFSAEDIEKMKKERFENWVRMINEESKKETDEIIP